MSTTFPEDTLIEAVRGSSPELRIRVLHELLSDCLKSQAAWPVAVNDDQNQVVAFLFPRPGVAGKSAPTVSPEREAELNERLKDLSDSRDLRDYVAELNSSGG